FVGGRPAASDGRSSLELQLVSDPCQIRERTGGHFSHDLSAMHLDGDFADTELCCDLLVEAACNHTEHDFALALRQSFKASAQLMHRALVLDTSAILVYAGIDGIQQLLLAKRLGQKLDGPPLHRLHRHGYVAVSRDEHRRQVNVSRRQVTLKIN